MASRQKNTRELFPTPPISTLVDEWRDGKRVYLFKSENGLRPISRKILRSVTDILNPEHVYSAYHYHEGVEIFRILSGSAEMVINNRSVSVGEGDLVIVNAFQAHGTYLKGADLRFSRSCVMFHPYRIFPSEGGDGRFFADLKSISFQNRIPRDHPANKLLREIIDHIITLFRERPPVWTVAAYAAVMQFYTVAIEKGLTHESEDNTSYLFEFMTRVSGYIEDHLDEDISTTDIAAFCQYSTEHFCRIFKKCFDKTFKDYLNIYRIQKAKEFMETGSFETLAQISSKCGFNNQNHFSHMFKKHVGALPSEYWSQKHENA